MSSAAVNFEDLLLQYGSMRPSPHPGPALVDSQLLPAPRRTALQLYSLLEVAFATGYAGPEVPVPFADGALADLTSDSGTGLLARSYNLILPQLFLNRLQGNPQTSPFTEAETDLLVMSFLTKYSQAIDDPGLEAFLSLLSSSGCDQDRWKEVLKAYSDPITLLNAINSPKPAYEQLELVGVWHFLEWALDLDDFLTGYVRDQLLRAYMWHSFWYPLQINGPSAMKFVDELTSVLSWADSYRTNRNLESRTIEAMPLALRASASHIHAAREAVSRLISPAYGIPLIERVGNSSVPPQFVSDSTFRLALAAATTIMAQHNSSSHVRGLALFAQSRASHIPLFFGEDDDGAVYLICAADLTLRGISLGDALYDVESTDTPGLFSVRNGSSAVIDDFLAGGGSISLRENTL